MSLRLFVAGLLLYCHVYLPTALSFISPWAPSGRACTVTTTKDSRPFPISAAFLASKPSVDSSVARASAAFMLGPSLLLLTTTPVWRRGIEPKGFPLRANVAVLAGENTFQPAAFKAD